uniref:Ribonuclease E inhibitor RraB n=1 Tax=Schlesneria paludicola TaxID=360056 RepID=A0A7C2NVA2_9PLAN
MTSFPDDADGEVLAELAAHGVDLSQPLEIEFPVAVPDEASADKTQAALAKAGYESRIEYDEGEPDEEGNIDPDDEEFGPAWTVYVNRLMVPEHGEIQRIQAELDRLSQPFGGYCDGWGVLLDEDLDLEDD